MKKTNRFFLVALIGIILSFGLTSCMQQVNVPAGNVGIQVDLYGQDKGVQNQTLDIGQYWINNWTQQIFLYPVYTIQYNFEADSPDPTDPSKPHKDLSVQFTDNQGNACSVDIGIQAQVDKEHVTQLFQKYRETVEVVINTQVRSRLINFFNTAVASYTIADLYGVKRNDLAAVVQKALQDEFNPIGLNIINVSLLSKVRFAQSVEDAITAKVTADQTTLQKEQLVKQAEAEAKIKVAQAQGEAESNAIRNQSLSGTSIEWEKLQIQRAAVEKWDGHLPTTNASTSLPFLDIK